MSSHRFIAICHAFFSPCTQAPLNWGKKDEPVYVTEESGVVGLNFHQSKEALIYDSTNGIANHYDVRGSFTCTSRWITLTQCPRCIYARFFFRFFPRIFFLSRPFKLEITLHSLIYYNTLIYYNLHSLIYYNTLIYYN